MSNIFIHDIVGTGAYAVPTSDAELHALDELFYNLLTAVVDDFTMERAIAWVKDSAGSDGEGGVRTLNCLMTGVYVAEDCPSEAEADVIFAAIEAALLAVGGGGVITSVGLQEYNIVAYV
jgi:hypothetical protein